MFPNLKNLKIRVIKPIHYDYNKLPLSQRRSAKVMQITKYINLVITMKYSSDQNIIYPFIQDLFMIYDSFHSLLISI